MKRIALILLLLSSQLMAQNFKEKAVKSNISEVTVFLQGAQVTRTAKAEISPGNYLLRVESLSPHIDEKSIQVKAIGSFTILSVNHKLNHLNSLKKDKKVDSLNLLIKKLENDKALKMARLEVLEEKLNLLDRNNDLGGQNAGASLTQIKSAMDFYDREITAIKKEEIGTTQAIQELQVRQNQLRKEISLVQGEEERPSGEIEIRIEAKQKSTAQLTLTYLVANAGWYPKYDVRVASVEKPLQLKYKADIYQNTGIDWEKVKLKLSNGNPNQSGVAPELQTWYLNYASHTQFQRQVSEMMNPGANVKTVSGRITDAEGQPLPGVNVLVKGSTVGTVTNLDGYYSLTLPNNARALVVSFVGMVTKELPINAQNINARLENDVSQLDEVVVVAQGLSRKSSGIRVRGNSSLGYATPKADYITTTTVENQTTVEFELDKPYSIKSQGDKLTVDLKSFDIETLYEYYAVPKLDKDAFLIARIINWDQYNLLEGEANLYFEDAYVGRSVLDARSLEDTLNISLGRDKSIVIGREKIDQFTKRRTIGANRVETRSFKITVRNKKSQAIKLTLFDQLPVSVNSNITVNPLTISNGEHDQQTGEVKWELDLKAQQNTELEMGYEVKYPKNQRVYLE